MNGWPTFNNWTGHYFNGDQLPGLAEQQEAGSGSFEACQELLASFVGPSAATALKALHNGVEAEFQIRDDQRTLVVKDVDYQSVAAVPLQTNQWDPDRYGAILPGRSSERALVTRSIIGASLVFIVMSPLDLLAVMAPVWDELDWNSGEKSPAEVGAHRIGYCIVDRSLKKIPLRVCRRLQGKRVRILSPNSRECISSAWRWEDALREYALKVDTRICPRAGWTLVDEYRSALNRCPFGMTSVEGLGIIP